MDEGITEAQIWADLDAVYNLPDREDADIDAWQISHRYGVSMNAAWRRMDKMVATGEYRIVMVRDESSNTGKRKVIRRVKR